MSECPSAAWDRHIAAETAQHEDACFQCATDNGHSIEEAQTCDEGDVGCFNCPFEDSDASCPSCKSLRVVLVEDGRMPADADLAHCLDCQTKWAIF